MEQQQQQLIEQFVEKLKRSNVEFETQPIVGTDQRYHYLYLTFNIINHRFYVGLHNTDKPFDRHYHGSGIAIKQAIKKYGSVNLPSTAFAYFKDKMCLEQGEQLIVDDVFLLQYAGITYNVKNGGIVNSINKQHSEFMKNLYADQQYKEFWLQRVEQSKQQPANCHKESELQRKQRYQHCGQLSKKRMLELKQNDPNAFKCHMAKMQTEAAKVNGKQIKVTNLQTGEVQIFRSKQSAANQLNITTTNIQSLIRKSPLAEYANLYSIEYVDHQLQQSVKPIVHKGRKHLMKSVSCFDLSGQFVRSFPSVMAAAKFVNASNSTVIAQAIKHNYVSFGYRWKYNES